MNEQFSILLKAAIDLQKSQNEVNSQIKQLQKNAAEIKIELSTTNAKKALKELSSEAQQALGQNKIKLDNNITSFIKNNTKLSKDLVSQLTNVRDKIKDADSTSLKGLNGEFRTITSSARAFGEVGNTAFVTLVKHAKELIGFFGSATLVMGTVRAFQSLNATVIELDKATVDLQMATGATNTETKKLLSTYIEMGQQLGATGTEIANAASSWLKQGKSIAETNTLIKDSIILSKLGSLESADATKYLTTITKSYGIAVEDTLSVVDKLSKVDLTSATDVGGLASALNEVSSNAQSLGVNLDELLGYIAAIGETSGEQMSAVGNSLNTMFSRMANIKLKRLVDPTTGEDLSNTETSLRRVGIELRKDNETFRDFSDVLTEVANNWSGYNDVTKQSIAASIAGVDHINDFKILMQQFAKATEYTTASQNSAGSAMEKFSAYEEGAEAKTKKLQASLQELALDTLDSQVVKSFLDVSNVLVNLLDNIGLFNIAVVALSGVIAAKTTLGMNAFSFAIDSLITKMGVATGVATTLSSVLSVIIPTAVILGGITLATRLYDELNVTLEEQIETTQQLKTEYEDLQNQLKTANSELQTTSDRMNELLNKDSLTFVEKGELEDLKETNKELQTKIDLLQKQSEYKNQELNTSIKSEYEKKYGSDSKSNHTIAEAGMAWYDQSKWAGTEEGYVDYLIDRTEKLNAIKAKGNKLTKEEQSEYEKNIKYLTNVGVDYADFASRYTVNDETKQSWLDMADIINKIVNPEQYKTDTFDNIFNSDSFAKAKKELQEIASAGKLTPETISSNKEYQELLSKTGLTASEVADQINAMVQASDAVGSTGVATLKSYKDVIDQVSKNVKLATEAQYELSESGVLGYDTVSDLLEVYPNLVDKLTLTENGYITTKEALDELITSQSSEYQMAYDDAVDACNKFINNEKLKQAGIDGTTNSIKDQMYAMLKLYETQGVASGDTLREVQNQDTYQSMLSAWMNVGVTEKNLETATKVIKNVQDKTTKDLKDKAKKSQKEFSSSIDLIAQTIQNLKDTVDDAQTKFSELDLSEVSNNLFKNSKKIVDSYDDIIKKRKSLGTNFVGNVDVNNRPIVINKDGSYSTTKTAFQEKWVGNEDNGGYKIIHYTPILPDGTVLEGEALNKYIDKILNSSDSLKADSPKNGGYGIVYKVDTEINGKKITDKNLNEAFKVADAWDVNMHDVQNKLYKTEAGYLTSISKLAKDSGLSVKEYTNLIKSSGNDASFMAQKLAINELIEAQKKLKQGYTDAATSYKTQYDKISGISNYKKLIESGKITSSTLSMSNFTDEKLYNKVKSALDLYNSYQSSNNSVVDTENSIKKTQKQSSDLTINKAFSDLEHNYAMGKIKEADYQKQRWELAKKYYWKNAEYAEDWKKEQEEWHKFNVSQDEEEKKKKLDSINAVVNRYKESISNIKDLASSYNDGSPEQMTVLSYGVEKATDEIAFLQEQIKKLNAEYKNDKSNEIYISGLESLTSSLKDAKNSVKDLQSTIVDSIEASKKTALDDLEKAYSKNVESLNKEKDAYEEIIDLQKKSLQAEKEKNDYNKSIEKQTKAIAKDQARMAELEKAARSGDRQASAELEKLKESLSDKQEELDETQADHKYDLDMDALDTSLDNHNKLIQTELDGAKTVYDQKVLDITSLYDKEKEYAEKAALYTKTQFSTAITDINNQLSKLGVAISSSATSSLLSAQSNMASGSPTYVTGDNGLSSTSNADIEALLKGGTGSTGNSALNQYVYSKYGTYLSFSEMIQLAKKLGISGISSIEDVKSDANNRTMILNTLKAKKFGTGGVLTAPSGSNNYVKQTTGEDGWYLGKAGEGILKPRETEAHIKLGSMYTKMESFFRSYEPRALSSNNYTTNNTNTPSVKIDNLLTIQGNVDKNVVSDLNSSMNTLVNKVTTKVMSEMLKR